MATIRKRGDYQWQAIVKRTGFPYTSKTFELRSDATAWARLIESEMDQRTWTPRRASEHTLLRDLIQRYRKDVLPTKRGKHFGPALKLLDLRLGKYPVATLTSARIADFRDQRLRAAKSASTIRKELNLLSRILKLGMHEWGVPLPANPCKDVSRPIEDNARTRRLRPGEEEYLLTATRPEISQLVQMALETAARLGELLALEWTNVDLERRVARTYGIGKKGTKNGAPFRAIPLSHTAIELLTSLPRKDVRVFPTWRGSDSFNKAWHTAVRHAQEAYVRDCGTKGDEPEPDFLKDLVFHDLRHEATSRLFEKRKLDSMEIAAITGHKTLAMLRRYTHLDASELAKQLD
jgi:integrase